MNRRSFFVAASGAALTFGNASSSRAFPFVPAWGALKVAAEAWGMYSAGKEIYERLFSTAKKDQIQALQNNVYNGNTTINNYNYVENKFKQREFSEKEPALTCLGRQQDVFLVTRTQHSGIVLAPGFVNGIGSGLIPEAQSLFRNDEEKVSAFTRPMRIIQAPLVWREGGFGASVELWYQTPWGVVTLQWLVEDNFGRQIHLTRYRLRDNRQQNLIFGETQPYG